MPKVSRISVCACTHPGKQEAVTQSRHFHILKESSLLNERGAVVYFHHRGCNENPVQASSECPVSS